MEPNRATHHKFPLISFWFVIVVIYIYNSCLRILTNITESMNCNTFYLFLIYINDLPDNIQSSCKIFAADTSLFSHVSGKYKSQVELNNDLQVICNWAFQWKMQLNPDPHKQAQEEYFSKKSNDQKSLLL